MESGGLNTLTTDSSQGGRRFCSFHASNKFRARVDPGHLNGRNGPGKGSRLVGAGRGGAFGALGALGAFGRMIRCLLVFGLSHVETIRLRAEETVEMEGIVFLNDLSSYIQHMLCFMFPLLDRLVAASKTSSYPPSET